METWQNTLYYGDNLRILREYFANESVDLVYLDPPFNSNRNYNVLFKDESGQDSEAQLTAFEDTWHWDRAAEAAYDELASNSPQRIALMIGALREFIGTNQLLAYVVMMTIRLIELARVLKPTGSLYLHCDPTASHYLKMVLDTILGVTHFQSEIIWKRSASHGGATRYHNNHDVILYFSKSDAPTWNAPCVPHEQSYLESHYTQVAEDGRRYQLISAHGAGQGVPRKFGEKMIEPPPRRHWMSQEHIDQMMAAGKVVFTKTGMPSYKRYLDETEGMPLGTVWHDIFPVNSQAKERLGYPTQKPVTLLERIIAASSREGDVVLDPFCGCGTTIHAAQKLRRRWLGIDVTHLAIAIQKYRLKDAFGLLEKQDYQVMGEPEDLQAARQLAQDDRYQFQWWALSLIQAQPIGGAPGSKKGKKGADRGIDGIITFLDDPKSKPKKLLVQVKSGKVKSGDIRDLAGTIEREKAVMGVFLTLEEPTKDMHKEAVAAGFYHSPNWHKAYPKLQILTIERLLSGATVQMPPTAMTYKKAQREQTPGAVQDMLL